MSSEMYAKYNSRFGKMKIVYNNNAIIQIKKIEDHDNNDDGVCTTLSDLAFEQIEEYMAEKRTLFDFPYELIGTEFQKRVWKALYDIPYGETRTYKEIAIKVGNINASRAVGMANNKNPMAIVVPCHRVIGSNGKLVGYAGGLNMKSDLIELEKKCR